MISFGMSFDVTPALSKQVEGVVCQLYGAKGQSNINDLRYKMLCVKAAQSSLLPPCRDALQKHILRANYQAAIWRQALEPNLNIPSPHRQGWTV